MIDQEERTERFRVPAKLMPLIQAPRRYNLIEGGRGGAKSWTMADDYLADCMRRKIRCLGTREVQKSIDESVHALFKIKIQEKKLPFIVLKNKIMCAQTGSEIIFHGLRDDTTKSIKSLEGIDRCWVEEAQYVSKASLDILIPTIRKPGSRIDFSFNRFEEVDPIIDRFGDENDTHDPDVLHIKLNYYDNPWCPEELKKEAEKCRIERPQDYEHIWLGKPLSRKGRIFNNYRVEDFSDLEKTFDRFKFGLDWGFADDPLAFVKLYYDKKHKRLYVCDELYLYGHTNDKSAIPIKRLAGKGIIKADSSEPKSVQEMRGYGLNIYSAKKGAGSIEHGIRFLQSLEIIVHPRCINFKKELNKYRYKTDRGGNVIPEPLDAFNHGIDATRYAMEDESIGGNVSGIA